jgi:hypothetical protein
MHAHVACADASKAVGSGMRRERKRAAIKAASGQGAASLGTHHAPGADDDEGARDALSGTEEDTADSDDDGDTLAADYRLLRQRKRGRISEAQFSAAFADLVEDDEDEEEESASAVGSGSSSD